MEKKAAKGVLNVKRRTWDEGEYLAKAQERKEQEGVVTKKEVNSNKEEFQKASADAAGPLGSQRAFLQARQGKVDILSKLGSTEKINGTGVTKASGGGYYCEVCECMLKDSVAYLDHINGRKHQRALGFSMRVARSSLDDVKNRFVQNKRKREMDAAPKPSAMESYKDKIRKIEEAEEADKQRKKAAKQKKREDKAKQVEEEQAPVDAEMMAMMGFGGFGGGAKRSKEDQDPR